MRNAVVFVASYCFLSIFQPSLAGLPKDDEDATFWMKKAQMELTNALTLTTNENVAKNVVLFLGDGMGISTGTAARILKGQLNGMPGEETVLAMEIFPHVALSKTYGTDIQTQDSAGSGTAFLSGVKTRVGVIGLDTKAISANCSSQKGREVTSILDWALEAGKSVGIVTTTRVTHATPAAAYAHASMRYWESDADMVNVTGGCKDITLQLIEDNPNIQVILGGGRQTFLPQGARDVETGELNGIHGRLDGRDLIQEWQDDKRNRNLKHKYVWKKDDFDSINPDETDYLLGLFAASNLEYNVDRDAGPDGEPSLSELTDKAIKILQKNDKGFFLLVEGGKIDLAHHENWAKKALLETIEFDNAVKNGMDLLSEEDSLLVVTADHSHVFTLAGYAPRGNDILGEVGPIGDGWPLDDKPDTTLGYANGNFTLDPITGRANITGVDTGDKEYKFQAAIPKLYETHGGEDVAIFARGPMSHLFHGVHEQNYIAHVMGYAACIGGNKEHCTKKIAYNTISQSTSYRNNDMSIYLIFAVAFIICH